MNVFEAVKQSVTTRQAAEHYGIKVRRNGMACCPFHNDKTPSMKLDKRFHCFGCGADGDVIDFVAALYGLDKKQAAAQLASDFGIAYENWKPPDKTRKPLPRQKSPAEQFREALLPCLGRLLSSAQTLENRVCAQNPGRRMSSPVRGSLAENEPCGISAGHAAVRRAGRKGFPHSRIRKGSETA